MLRSLALTSSPFELEAYRTKLEGKPKRVKGIVEIPEACLEKRGFLCPLCKTFWVFHIYIRNNPFLITCDCGLFCLYDWKKEDIILGDLRGMDGIVERDLEFILLEE